MSFVLMKGVFTNRPWLKYAPLSIPLVGFLIGRRMQYEYDEKARSFHNKSMLYGGRDLKPGERAW